MTLTESEISELYHKLHDMRKEHLGYSVLDDPALILDLSADIKVKITQINGEKGMTGFEYSHLNFE